MRYHVTLKSGILERTSINVPIVTDVNEFGGTDVWYLTDNKPDSLQ